MDLKLTNGKDWAALLLRIVGGGFMLTHGAPKLFKIINGDWSFGNPIGIGEEASLILTVLAEFACAALVLIGYKTRLASIPLIITMLVAAFIVHGSDPFGDKEMALIYLIIYASIFALGPGKYSIDKD
jgi:putative oxidoreductase